MGKDAAWVAASFFLVFRFLFSFVFSGFIFATSPFRTFIKYTSNDNRDVYKRQGEEYELDRMLPYVANETDDGMSVTVYFERVESNGE